MKQLSRKILNGSVVILMAMGMLAAIPFNAAAAATTLKEDIQVAPGIDYRDVRLADTVSHQALKVMEIDLNAPYTKVDVGVPSALNKLERTTAQAQRYTQEGNTVVGAINASFFYSGTAMNLVSKNNRLVHSGEVFPGEDKYVNEPIAFGLNSAGKGIIDHYNLNISYIHNGSQSPITGTNKARYANNTILYTSDFPGGYTGTNIYGTEVIVTLPMAPDLEFGSTVEGTVEAIRKEGDPTSTQIPVNGFVLSGNGVGSDALKTIKVGDPISLNINVDDKWKDSAFMLASGPMLVKGGQVSLSMDSKSPNAGTRAPRTAVAIDKTGSKVFFVTVDGRQSDYSNGMNLTEFARYLVSMGADRALNLDGGGSTTMAVRFPGSEELTLANSPSDGYERSVSTILMAVSTAPKPVFNDVGVSFWAFKEIDELVKKGTIKGFPDLSFRPDEPITRSHAAVMLTREMGLNTAIISNPGFDDVLENDPYYKDIAAAENAGLLKGRGQGVFAKDSNLTRAEMAAIIQRAFNIPVTSQSFYPDLASHHWAFNSINAVTQQKIAGGYPDGKYKPDNQVTRAEFSAFIYRANIR
ncbi:hypothetical protein FZC79_18425 [Rossellomorea vietnamensis]|uniref:SLH domain-containing protein n=1 Tax=Rossellomorea vietnamensis TaxID=218284 RepID=A0A5D4K9M9_9BACI|nr:phosphodiester glycosidase family protein [Rossellomorea vietnamensis]TYR73420.1 hypothetical protein FZC79_18425 [Rossellomorea vietnamensis]